MPVALSSCRCFSPAIEEDVGDMLAKDKPDQPAPTLRYDLQRLKHLCASLHATWEHFMTRIVAQGEGTRHDCGLEDGQEVERDSRYCMQ